MNVQTHSARIVVLRPDVLPTVVDGVTKTHESKTFNAEFLSRLRALNAVLRWLRQAGYSPMTMHLQGRLPTIHVDGAAARLLIAEAQGFAGRRVNDTHRHCSVELRGCLITWFEPL